MKEIKWRGKFKNKELMREQHKIVDKLLSIYLTFSPDEGQTKSFEKRLLSAIFKFCTIKNLFKCTSVIHNLA